MSETRFFQRLEQRALAANSLLCIGLDPHPDILAAPSASTARDFCRRLIDQTIDQACAYKPNSAFFEVYGAEGFDALRGVIDHVPEDIPVILDSKRGDIASTAEAYAQSVFGFFNADAVTLNAYMGYDAVYPFVSYTKKGAFILCKTSNPGADVFQNLMVQDKPLYEIVAFQALNWNVHDNIGLVIGATDVEALTRVRAIAERMWFLIPGVGAQGGDLHSALVAGLRPDRLGVLVNVSRSVAKASDPGAEARRLQDQINDIRPMRRVQARIRSTSSLERVAAALAQSGCVQFGEFTLKSGEISPIYLDLRRLVSQPEAMRVVAGALSEKLRGLVFDHIAALPYAALPIGTATALAHNCSLVYPRREVKDYGTKASVEGVFRAGEIAVVLDDLATTGETKFEAIAQLKESGLIVNDILVVIDRERGAAKTLTEAGYRFHAVAALSELLPIWERHGVIDAVRRSEVEAYLSRRSG
jgi:uridine monophosphate synthetase